jgi:hypothetical protein
MSTFLFASVLVDCSCVAGFLLSETRGKGHGFLKNLLDLSA